MTCEVVVYNIDSALRAQEGDADRIELCDNPAEGGTTPSFGMIEQVRKNISIDVYVMLRPRGGDFCYNNYEFHIMKRDLSQCQRLSVDGLVFGILTEEGRIDKKRCKELIDKTRPLKVTCHRAFDMTRDPFEALEDCIEIGFDRILTSGQRPKALDGVSLISELTKRANGRIAIMAGSGVNENTVTEIVKTAGVNEIHFSATSFLNSSMQFRNPHIAAMGEEAGAEFNYRTVDPDRVRNIRSLAEAASL
ncbi:MAG: copper homeostasis protein CutC [Cyclobacteriaceae bacterium]|nr:copper homeostasis protein CutC [Cyclobacteriaceae bacterium]